MDRTELGRQMISRHTVGAPGYLVEEEEEEGRARGVLECRPLRGDIRGAEWPLQMLYTLCSIQPGELALSCNPSYLGG